MKKALFLLCFITSSFCRAGTQTGTVTDVIVRASDGLIYFSLNGTTTGSPNCAVGGGYWVIKDENSNSGKQQYAMLLAAHASGQKVGVAGLGTCTRWSNLEDVNYIVFED
jgi:hypothetical protein